jgi:hypothetical protein
LLERFKAWFVGVQHEVIVRSDHVDARLSILDAATVRAGSSKFDGLDLRALARGSSCDQILTISDRVDLDDLAAFAELERLLLADPVCASASCLLLHEVSINKQRVLQPASGGLFPSRIAFDAAPRLAFVEPDVSDALRDMIYPVAANTSFFTLWRKSALAELPDRLGTMPDAAADIRLGLDLIEAGHSNVCTTQVAVSISGSYHRRNVVDPLGEAYVGIDRWQDILRRVTVVRELY